MARPLRIIFAGAWYHVMNRGAGKKIIFRSDAERCIFLELLERTNQRFKIEIHAYCLMDNHYHLLVRTHLPNLSEAIKYLNAVYAQKVNIINNTDGPLFRGRFKAKLVDSDEYLTHLSRYIHLNPTEAKLCQYPWEYKWSSCNSYLGIKQKQSWLFTNEILDMFKSDKSNKYHLYREFLLAGNDNNIINFLNKQFPVLGSEEFVKNIAKKYFNRIPHDEIPEERLIQQINIASLTEISTAICKSFNIPIDNLFHQKGKNYIARNIFIYLAIEICNKKLGDIESLFPNIKKSRISVIYKKIVNSVKNDDQLKSEIDEIVRLCGK